MDPQLLKLSLLRSSASIQEAELILLGVKLLYSIGSRLSVEDQEDFVKYLQTLPDFFLTDDGAEVSRLILSYIKEKPAKA